MSWPTTRRSALTRLSAIDSRSQRSRVSPGDVAVVMINEEEATLKRVRVMDAQVLLYPANSNYVPTVHPIQQVKIIGKVVKAEISFT